MATEMKTRVSKQLRLDSNSGECQRLYDFLVKTLAPLPLTEEFRHDLKLVAEELLANIINHAYRNTAEAVIDIELAVNDHSVRITFTDSGPVFNPLDYGSPDTGNDLSEGGMGILLVKSLTDAQSYKRENGFNVFTVTKNYNT